MIYYFVGSLEGLGSAMGRLLPSVNTKERHLMVNVTLTAQRRHIFGKKVKTLRREGILPANFYGKGVETTAIQISERDFEQIFRTVPKGESFNLDIEGTTYPVVIYVVQRHPVTRKFLHIDFKLA
jgi:Ribosomal protein L25 (general stress protein Ctc)